MKFSMQTFAHVVRSVHAWQYGALPDQSLMQVPVGPMPSTMSSALGMQWQDICRFLLAVDAWQSREVDDLHLEIAFSDLIPQHAIEYAFGNLRGRP